MKRVIFFILSACCLVSCNNSTEKLSLVEKGDLAFSRREYVNAANLWNGAHRKDPGDIALMRKLCNVYVKLGRFDRALHILEQALEIVPDDINICLQMARLNILTLDYSQAEKVLLNLEEKNIQRPELSTLKADIFLIKDQKEKAEKYYRKAVIESKDSINALLKLAIFLAAEDRISESQEIFNIAAKNVIDNTETLLLMSDYFLLAQHPDQAEQAILKAIRMEPEELALKYHLIKYYLSKEYHYKAEQVIQSLLKNQDDIYLLMTLADVYLATSRFPDAQSVIDQLNGRIKDKIPEFELLKAKYWLLSRKPVFATSHLKTAIDLKPGLINTRYFLGLTHLMNGKTKLAENSLLQTLQIEPSHYTAGLLISALLYKEKEYSLSVKYLDQFFKIYPKDVTGIILYGLNLMEMSDYLGALEQFVKAADQNTDEQHIALYYLGRAFEYQQQYNQALQQYETILKQFPQLVDVAYRYCLMLINTGQVKRVRDFMEQQLALAPESVEVNYIFSKTAEKMNDDKKQEELLKKAVSLAQTNGMVFIELSKLYKRQGKFKQSAAILRECVTIVPNYESGWLALSQAYVEENDLISALEIMEKGLPKFKDSPVYQSNLAWLYLESGKQISKALNLAQAAYDKNPDNIAIADTLGWAYYHKGIYSQALWLLSDIEKKAPGNSYIKYHLGMTYYHMDDFDKARQYLGKARLSVESENFVKEIESTLDQINNSKQVPDKEKSKDSSESLIADPESNLMEEDIIQPQWKQQHSAD